MIHLVAVQTFSRWLCRVVSPKSFQVNIPIFRGQPKSVIEVEFDHYVVDGECVLQLVSPGANDEVEAYRDKCIDEVLDAIRKIAPEIAIMEK